MTTLTRHFVSGLVSPPILTDLGHDYLRRTLSSLVAILLVIGIFVPRAFSKKYMDLGANLYREVYDRALHADIVLMIALPMLIVGLIAVILCPLLFPDETDYRVLTPLPISRARIFTAKLLAVIIVVGVCVLAVNLIASIWFPMVTGGWRVRHPLPLRVAAHAAATLAASAWMFSAVMAIQGLCLVLLPGRAQQRIGLLLQALLFVGLLVSIPSVVRIPVLDVSATSVLRPPLVWLPPVWFAGIEHRLLDGDAAGGYVMVSRIALWAFAITLSAIALAYFVLYRSAERLAGMSSVASYRPSRTTLFARCADRLQLHPSTTAVIDFIVSGLTRSRLHQFVFLLIAAAGAALVIDSIMTVREAAGTFGSRPSAAVRAAIAAPFTAALTVVLALRMSILLPLDINAAWAFRIAEDTRMRHAALNGVAHAITAAALAPSMIVLVLLQRGVLGNSMLLSAPLTLLACLILVEWVLTDWNRIPFTCTYLPGKRVMAYTLGVILAFFVVFVGIGANLVRWGVTHPSRAIFVGGLLLAAFAALRRSRLRSWGELPLQFEDEDPLAIRTLGVLADERR